MGDYTAKQKQEESAVGRPHRADHIDVESEHDAKRARRVSNAVLRRVTDAGSDMQASANRTALHEAAGRKTYDSVQSGLLLLAKEMHLAPSDLRAAQVADPEHNNSNGIDTIERVIHMISADAHNLDATMASVDNVATMGPEVKTVWGAWQAIRDDVKRATAVA